METRSIAMIAVLAVAAVAIVGAGYAYWGMTEVDNNDVKSNYIAVALTEANNKDYTALDYEIEYNTTYKIVGGQAKYQIAPTSFVTGFDSTTDSTKNLLPVKNIANATDPTKLEIDHYEITLKSSKVFDPEEEDAIDYNFTITLNGVTLGSAVKLWFVSSENTSLSKTDDTWVQLTNTSGTCTGTISSDDLKVTYSDDGEGYKAVGYGFLVADVAGTAVAVEGVGNVQLADVNAAQIVINSGKLSFKAETA